MNCERNYTIGLKFLYIVHINFPNYRIPEYFPLSRYAFQILFWLNLIWVKNAGCLDYGLVSLDIVKWAWNPEFLEPSDTVCRSHAIRVESESSFSIWNSLTSICLWAFVYQRKIAFSHTQHHSPFAFQPLTLSPTTKIRNQIRYKTECLIKVIGSKNPTEQRSTFHHDVTPTVEKHLRILLNTILPKTDIPDMVTLKVRQERNQDHSTTHPPSPPSGQWCR